MAEETRFSAEDPAEVRRRAAAADRDVETFGVEPPPRGCGKSCLIGCLWTGLVVTILGVILGIWISRNWRKWFAEGGAEVLKQGIAETELPRQEQDELSVEVDRVAEAFREGRLSGRQIAEIARQLFESPLATSLIVSVVDAKYLNGSGLADDEKVEGRRTLRRFARGVIDNKIPEAQRNAVLATIADRQPDGNWKLRENVTDDDLRTFLTAAKTEADAAAIAEEPEVVDPSDELRKIVDAALAENAENAGSDNGAADVPEENN